MNTNENRITKEVEHTPQQLQIDWDSLPPEANWVAQDSDGQVLWHENKPKVRGDYWGGGGRCGSIDNAIKNWKETLWQRPKPKNILCNGFEVEDGGLDFIEGDIYYVPCIDRSEFYFSSQWSCMDIDIEREEKGLAYKTKEGAIRRAKAMLGIKPDE